MDTYNFDEDLIEVPKGSHEPADDREVIECLWWTRSDWEKQRWRFSQPAWKAQSPLPEIRTLYGTIRSASFHQRSQTDFHCLAVADTRARAGGRTSTVRSRRDLESEFEDDEDRPIQLLAHESDAGEARKSKASPDSRRASTSGTEGMSSLTSGSVGRKIPAGGKTLNIHSHGSISSSGRDKPIKSGSAAKGKKVIRPRHPGKKVAQPRKPSRKASKATEDGVEEKHFEKDSMGYADPIEVLEHLKRAQKLFKTSAFKVVFPVDQGFTVDEKGKRRCGIRGAIAASGLAMGRTDCEPCGIEVATGESYRRHVLEAHFGIPRGRRKEDQQERLKKRIGEHYDAESRGRKRKAEDDNDEYEDGERRQRKRVKKQASSLE
ncbi:SubName: Full=Uncharacterized protein {ECO:0000313/EMBL:CCA76032.1} [Serendipita indica DSM 11827]|nr:SubName: Full=Uncharacterized protein {ECO:0000313/EMBL:CCA76032.1} [Serendipita indica DSM 11827]